MQHLEGSGTPVLYIDAWFLKVKIWLASYGITNEVLVKLNGSLGMGHTVVLRKKYNNLNNRLSFATIICQTISC
jgi:hypothetical protein